MLSVSQLNMLCVLQILCSLREMCSVSIIFIYNNFVQKKLQKGYNKEEPTHHIGGCYTPKFTKKNKLKKKLKKYVINCKNVSYFENCLLCFKNILSSVQVCCVCRYGPP